MKYKTTNKLFYDKYKFKLGVICPIAHIFRNKKLEYARSTIDNIINSKQGNSYFLKTRMHERPLTDSQVEDLKVLLNHFTFADQEYSLRCEGSYLGVYSNNKDWLLLLDSKLKNPNSTLFEPPKCIDLDANTIISENDTYQLKITLNGTADPNLANYCKKNPDKVRVGHAVLEDIERGYNLKGRYMFVKDEQTFTMISLFLNKNVLRTDKVLTIEKTDK